MLSPDFVNQAYFAEVLKGQSELLERLPTELSSLVATAWKEETVEIGEGDSVRVYHAFVPSSIPFHRALRERNLDSGEVLTLPRTKSIRRRDHYLYDILLLRRKRHLVVAVPFHGLAKKVFPDIDTALAGRRALYETLNITRLVVQLAANSDASHERRMVVTRCHLAYSDQANRKRDLEQVRVSGANLGDSDIYTSLIGPVLDPAHSTLAVTPVLLGFSLLVSGVRKSGAVSDRHGNFKVSLGNGLRQIARLFHLLDEVELMQGVTSTTSNIPILLSTAIGEDA